jgi:hypothetical protein
MTTTTSGRLVKLMGLWEVEGRNGVYLSGRIGDVKILVMPDRDHIDGDRTPTHVVLLCPAEPKGDRAGDGGTRPGTRNGTAGRRQDQGHYRRRDHADDLEDPDDRDIPPPRDEDRDGMYDDGDGSPF